MDHADAQIEIALLRSIERQANRTAAALQRVVDLLGEVGKKKGLIHAYTENKRRSPARRRRGGVPAPHCRRA